MSKPIESKIESLLAMLDRRSLAELFVLLEAVLRRQAKRVDASRQRLAA